MKTKSDSVVFHHSVLNVSNGNVRKLLEPQYPFTASQREAVMREILEFRQRLDVAGVPISTDYRLSIEEGLIVEHTTNCGTDGYKILKTDAASSGEMVLGQIVRAFCPIFLESEITVVPDPHPANWCFDNGVGRYIDFQPARFKREDGLKLVGFPQPTGEEYEWSIGRYYSKAGLVRILRFNAMRAGGSSMRDLLLSIMRKEWPKHLLKEISSELDNLLEEQVRRNELTVDEALECCDLWKVDDIRELAMIVAERGNSTATFLDQVLEKTRADFNLSLAIRQKGVEQAKALIRGQL